MMIFFIFTLFVAASAMPFEEFVNQYDRVYAREDYKLRQEIYEQNLLMIEEHNSKNLSYSLGVNEFADMTFDEFKAYRGLIGEPQNCSATHGTHKFHGATINSHGDWRDKGVVNPVRNQGSCGSCWAFSTIASVESHWAIAMGDLPMLSEQELIDCAGDFNNNGCNGGLPSQAFQYIIANGGIDGRDEYGPYTAKDGSCKYNVSYVDATLSDGVNITAKDEVELLDALAHEGPVNIAYEVVDDFRFYKNGVYDSTVCKDGPQDVNHAVVAVGWGTDEDTGKDYYLVRNSWGTGFGIDGYFKIVRNKNMCGLAVCASYPVV